MKEKTVSECVVPEKKRGTTKEYVNKKKQRQRMAGKLLEEERQKVEKERE